MPTLGLRSVATLLAGAFLALAAGCGKQNSYVPPPPAEVGVAHPLQRDVTPYLDATGSTVAYNDVDLVARIEGFVASINYQDGSEVKAGTKLFIIEQTPYQAKLQQAQASFASAQAAYVQSDAEYLRQSTLARKDFASQSALDQARAKRDSDKANVTNQQAGVALAGINLGYTTVAAPFDGVVTNHLVSVGALVGASGPTKLATIVQLAPIYVTFSISDQDVQRIRAGLASRGLTLKDVGTIPVDVELNTETGYPHHGVLDYVSPQVSSGTGTLTVRAVFQNHDHALLPGYFVRVRVPRARHGVASLLVPDAALGANQAGQYVMVVNKDNVVEQRSVTVGARDGSLRIIAAGLKPDDRVVVSGLSHAIPGEKVVAKPTPMPENRDPPMISRFFIDRPVLANVLAILFVLIGGVALFALPVAQYPNVVPPTVQVTTRYPGASAETVMNTVALPIEQSVNGVDRMLYMQSTSAADGSYTLTVTFQIGTDLNFAQVLVQNRVASAMAQLPTPVQAQGVQVQQRSTSILQIVTLTSPHRTYDSLYLSNYATLNLLNELSRIPGVGNVNVFGVGQYAMRVWLDPQLLYQRGLTPQDVEQAISQQSQQVAGGQLGAPPAPSDQSFQYTVNVAGRLADPKQFGAIVVKSQNGAVTRVRDVGRVELGAQTYSQVFRVNGAPAAGLAISLTPSANALQVAKLVDAKMQALSQNFPKDIAYAVPFDTTKFVNASINEVYHTLFEAAILVLIVIVLFLQDWRATLVPATTVPVTIIGAFAMMAALGFTINLSTLFAIVLAIGIVVDDAIVVVEGAAHHIERGLSAHDAAVQAMRELFGPIIGITLVLMSVFIPAAFLPGLTGQMYAQFALVIAATALISAINAATLKPTQCALWLRAPVPPEQRNIVFRAFNRGYFPLERGYVRLIGWMTHHTVPVVAIGLALIVVAFWGLARLPTAFIPTEDQGYVVIALQLPDGASLERTQAALSRAGKIARGVPGVDQVIEIAGISALDGNASLSSAGAAYVVLKDWGVRGKAKGEDLRSIYFHLQRALNGLPDGNALVIVPPPIQGIGNSNGFTMEIELRDGNFDWQKLQRITNTVVGDAATQTALQHAASTYRAEVPQLTVDVDRTKAETLHVSVGDVFNALVGYIGSSYVNQFNRFGRTFQVYVQADSRYRLNVRNLDALYVRSADGKMVPLGALVSVHRAVGPSLVTLYNLYPAATVVGLPAQGFSSGQAITLMEQIAQSVLPPGTGYDWTAMSYQEKAVGGQIYLVFALALVLVYLCLAGQYESWLSPFSVILAVPLALLGPALVLQALGLPNNLYTQIGIVLLIALAAKNAILIVEVARERRAEGATILAAAVAAAEVRFRPILMTSFAFILGMVPLVLSSGAGAAARVSLGLAVISGMTASTCLTVLFVPSFFVVMQRIEERRGAGRRVAAELAAPEEHRT